MADQLIEIVKSRNKETYFSELKKFEKQNTATKAEAAPKLLMKNLAYEDAIKIQGDVIYKKTIENKGLREQLGKIDEDKLKEYATWHQLNDTNSEKNKVIYDELINEINSTSNTLSNSIQLQKK